MTEAAEKSRPRLWCHPKTLSTVHALSKELPAGSKILDAGCGEGPLSELLAADGYRVTPCDSDTSRFRAQGLECVEADLDGRLPFADGQFDAVCAVEVVEHLENVTAFFREAARVLGPGGKLIVTTPNVLNFASRLRFLFSGFPSLFTRPLVEGGADSRHAHRRTLPYPSLRFELAEGGFSLTRVTTDKYRRGALALV